MRIKIIEEENYWELENLINEVLALLSPENIIDIKYSGCAARPPYSISKYSAMIILKE